MVRNLVGTFLLIGNGTVSVKEFRGILETRERRAAGPDRARWRVVSGFGGVLVVAWAFESPL